MSLADAVRAEAAQTAPVIPREHRAPTGWEPGVRYEAGAPVEVTLTVAAVPEDEKAWRHEIARVTGLVLPDNRRVEIQQVRYWGNPQEPQVYVRFGISDREAQREAADYPALIKVARANRVNRNPLLGTGRTRIVVMSDPQIGKVDSNGGTPELIARIDRILADLDAVAKAEPCDDVVILDPGDLTEGFESTAQEMHTNDLSFPEQLDMAQIILTHAVTSIAARFGSTRVATVPSNHTQWRKGKDRLGKPGDDFGLLTHRTVARALATRDDITFTMTGPWEESLALKVRGAVIGLVHGHQAQSGRIPQWWAGQSHGGQPTAAATILVTGHYHSFRMEPTGAIDGRARYWLQAPALDGGSSWWRHIKGDESEPGMVTFTVNDAGDWDSLRYLR